MKKINIDFFDSFNNGIIVVDKNCSIVYANEIIKDNLFSDKKIDVNKKKLKDVLSSYITENYKICDKIEKSIKEKKRCFFSYLTHRKGFFFIKDNKKISFNLYIIPYEKKHVILYFEDITELVLKIDKLVHITRQYKFLNRISLLLHDFNDLNTMAKEILVLFNRFIFKGKEKIFRFYLYNKAEKLLELVACCNNDEKIKNIVRRIAIDSKTFTAHAIKERKNYFIEDVLEYRERLPFLIKYFPKIKSLIILLLFDNKNDLQGAIHIGSETKLIFSKEEKRFFDIVSRLIAMGIDRFRYEQQLENNLKSVERIVKRRTKQLEQYSEVLEYTIQQYFYLIEDSKYIFCRYSKQGELLFANKAFLRYFGGQIGKKFFPKLIGDNYKTFSDLIKSLSSEQIIDEFDVNVETKSGPKWFRIAIRAFFNKETNQLHEYQIIGWDITEKREHEKKLKQHRERLAKYEKLSMLGRISASIIHEINTPVTFIRSNSEILRNELIDLKNRIKDMSKEEIEDVFKELIDINEDIFDGTDKIISITKGMRSFLTGERVKEIIFVKDLFFSVLNITYQKWQGKITVKEEVEDNQITIYGVKGQIEQVIINLFLNAIYAVGKTSKKIIWLQAFKYDDFHTLIVVKDTGIGIKKNDLPLIFEPLFTTKEENEGTGLGLPIVKEIVDSHNGHIKVKSKEGEGTSFEIILPSKKIS